MDYSGYSISTSCNCHVEGPSDQLTDNAGESDQLHNQPLLLGAVLTVPEFTIVSVKNNDDRKERPGPVYAVGIGEPYQVRMQFSFS